MLYLFVCSTDEGIMENMLKAMQAYIGLCGLLDMQVPRDTFITAVCKACLPPHYTLTVFANSAVQSLPTPYAMYDENHHAHHHYHQQYSGTTYGSESDYKQQVVAVGTPLATPSLAASSSSKQFVNLLINHYSVYIFNVHIRFNYN